MKLLLKLNEEMYEDFGEFEDIDAAKITAKFISQLKEVSIDDFYILPE